VAVGGGYQRGSGGSGVGSGRGGVRARGGEGSGGRHRAGQERAGSDCSVVLRVWPRPRFRHPVPQAPCVVFVGLGPGQATRDWDRVKKEMLRNANHCLIGERASAMAKVSALVDRALPGVAQVCAETDSLWGDQQIYVGVTAMLNLLSQAARSPGDKKRLLSQKLTYAEETLAESQVAIPTDLHAEVRAAILE
jgi:hypothetical protein